MSYYRSQVVIFVYQNSESGSRWSPPQSVRKWIAAQHRESFLSIYEQMKLLQSTHAQWSHIWSLNIQPHIEGSPADHLCNKSVWKERWKEKVAMNKSGMIILTSTSTIPLLHMLYSQAQTQRPLKVFNGISLATNFTRNLKCL